ncbi:hypothetical protein TNCV_2645791 [Trichonephila clavipes]|nr:hypothetical protein TNCV_2645791 [Trichonephila clavipes]
MVDARNLGVRFFCSSGIGSPSKIGCVLFLFSTLSPKNQTGLFVLSSITSLIGSEAGAVLHHLKIYGFSEPFNAGTFLTHPIKRNFTTSGQGGLVYIFQAVSGADSKTGTNLASHNLAC